MVVDNLVKEFKVYERGSGLTGSLRTLLSRDYRLVRAVDHVSFEIEEGAKVAYIGANGAGKSTTIKMLTGVMTPTSGSCLVGGIEPYRQRRLAARRMGVVFGQRTQLWWDLSVPDAFRILRRVYEIPDPVYHRNMALYRELLDIDALGTAPVRTLSLGQRMRAEVAASLVHDPAVLFLDEPTIGLDLFLKDAVRELINRVNRDLGTTVVLTSHDLNDIAAICDWVLVIDRGRVIHQGTISGLLATADQRCIVVNANGRHPAAEIASAVHRHLPGVRAQPTDGGRVEVCYPPDRVSSRAVLSFLLDRFDIGEWYAPEPDLAGVIRAIYASPAVPAGRDGTAC
ncbi:MAG TPA: ATP-binding cassette domain-containing protein [Rugosimonospora sp.]|nr:ATP-binding cassette domain-containing protein [Rugosimonospora sp.]